MNLSFLLFVAIFGTVSSASCNCPGGCCNFGLCSYFPHCGAAFDDVCSLTCDPQLSNACIYGQTTAGCTCGARGTPCPTTMKCENSQCVPKTAPPPPPPSCSNCGGGCCQGSQCKYFPWCGKELGGVCDSQRCNVEKTNSCAFGVPGWNCTCGALGRPCGLGQTCENGICIASVCSPCPGSNCCDGSSCNGFPFCGATRGGPCGVKCDPLRSTSCVYDGNGGVATCSCGVQGKQCEVNEKCFDGLCIPTAQPPPGGCGSSNIRCTDQQVCVNGECVTNFCFNCQGGCCDGSNCAYFPLCASRLNFPCTTQCDPTKSSSCLLTGSGPGQCTCGSLGRPCGADETCINAVCVPNNPVGCSASCQFGCCNAAQQCSFFPSCAGDGVFGSTCSLSCNPQTSNACIYAPGSGGCTCGARGSPCNTGTQCINGNCV